VLIAFMVAHPKHIRKTNLSNIVHVKKPPEQAAQAINKVLRTLSMGFSAHFCCSALSS
jgi:hypothetical protein